MRTPLILFVLLASSSLVGGAAWAETPADDPLRAIPGLPRIPSAGLGGPTQPATKPAAAGPGISGSFGGSILFEKVTDDYFATLDLYNETRIGPVQFGLWVPLRFRVIDRGVDDGTFREQDWDEASDYARVLRFVELNLGGERWRFRGRFGALEGESIGHGTIVAGYYNSLDRNHYQAGLLFDYALKYGGVALMLDNLLRPELFAYRMHVRPAAFFSDNVWANKLIIGHSAAVDAHAPVALVDAAPDDGQPDRDGEGNFSVAEHAVVSVIGFDVEYQLIHNEIFDLVPYIDLNFLLDRQTGAGFHLGTFFNIRVPTSIGPTLLTRLEYRAIGGGYAPRYVDSLYEVQRVQYAPYDAVDASADALPLTKLGWLRARSSGLNGWLGELYFDFAGWLIVGGSYEDYDGPLNAALTLGLHLPRFPLVQVGAFYTRRGFDGLDQAFELDGAMLVAYARAKVYGPLAATVVYQRSWQIGDDGRYQSQSDVSVGVGLAISY